MGWNGSDRKGTAPAQPKVTAKKPSPVRGIVAGLVVVLAAVVCYFAFFSESEKPAAKKAEKKPTAIKEVTPAAAPKVVEEPEEAPKVKKTLVQLQKERGCYTNELGYVFNRPTSKHVITNDQWKAHQTLAEKVFRNAADRKIGNLLLIPPGAPLVGELPKNFYGKSFVKSFLKSLEQPEFVLHDDPPEVAELKRAVIEAKAELKERYDAGEDIGEILMKERQTLQELGLYRRELDKELHKIARNEEIGKEDLEDFVTAANKMLADRGAEPLAMPKTAVRRFQLTEKKAETETADVTPAADSQKGDAAQSQE